MFLEDHALHKTLAESPAGTPPTQLTILAELAHIHTLAYMLESYIIKLACTGLPYWLGLGGFALES
jgi:hypothetical protein